MIDLFYDHPRLWTAVAVVAGFTVGALALSHFGSDAAAFGPLVCAAAAGMGVWIKLSSNPQLTAGQIKKEQDRSAVIKDSLRQTADLSKAISSFATRSNTATAAESFAGSLDDVAELGPDRLRVVNKMMSVHADEMRSFVQSYIGVESHPEEYQDAPVALGEADEQMVTLTSQALELNAMLHNEGMDRFEAGMTVLDHLSDVAPARI